LLNPRVVDPGSTLVHVSAYTTLNFLLASYAIIISKDENFVSDTLRFYSTVSNNVVLEWMLVSWLLYFRCV